MVPTLQLPRFRGIFGLELSLLVVSIPLKNVSQLGWLFPIYGKMKFMFQTTNQYHTSWCSMEKNTMSQLASDPMDFPWFFSRNLPFFKHIQVSQQVGNISQQYLHFTVYPYKDSGFNPHKLAKRQNSHENWQAFRLSTHQYPQKKYQVGVPSPKASSLWKTWTKTPQFRPVGGMQSVPMKSLDWMPLNAITNLKICFFTKGVIPIRILFFSPIKYLAEAIWGWTIIQLWYHDVTTSQRHNVIIFVQPTMFILEPPYCWWLWLENVIKLYPKAYSHTYRMDHEWFDDLRANSVPPSLQDQTMNIHEYPMKILTFLGG